MYLSIKIGILILAYLLGSIPFGLLIAKSKGVDIRAHGSKNIGSTNVGRILGRKYGILTFILDALKGGIIVALFRYNLISNNYILFNPLLYGLAAVIGHTLPIFIKFKGGKAVATSAGVILAFSPFTFIISVCIFLVVAKISKYISLSSIVGATFVFIMSIILYFVEKDILIPTLTYDIWYPIICLVMFSIIIIRHKANIFRLLNNKERKIKW